MATIKDIAREAGVSHGTVSNVLNKTGKVSTEKIRLVEAAAKKLGYVPNSQAQLLRQGSTSSIALIVPSLKEESCLYLYSALQMSLKSYNYDVAVYTTDDITEHESAIIRQLPISSLLAVITISAFNKEQSEENPYAQIPCPIFFVDRNPGFMRNGDYYISFDSAAISRDLIEYIRNHNYSRIALFSSPVSGTQRIYETFSKTFASENFLVSRFSSDMNLSLTYAFDIILSSVQYDLIITSNMLRADAVLNAIELSNLQQLPKVVALSPLSRIPNNRLSIYELDYSKIGLRIAQILFEPEIKSQIANPTIQIEPNGFPFTFPNIRKKTRDTLTLLTIDAPSTNALKKLSPMFQKASGITLKIVSMPYQDLHQQISLLSSNHYYDLIRMDIARLDSLSQMVYLPLSKVGINPHALPWEMVYDICDRNSIVNVPDFALPFDPSTQIFLYRKDLFENAIICRSFYEKYHQKLSVPTTFEQYLRVAEFFTQEYNPMSPTKFGATMTCGTASTTSSDFLPYFLSMIPEQEASLVLSGTEPLKRAMLLYKQMTQYATQQSWWMDSLRQFMNEEAATTILYSNYASSAINSKHSRVVGKIGASVVPGGHPLIGGGVIGICKYSQKIEACKQFFHWYYSEDISSLLVKLGGTSPLANSYSDIKNFDVFPWLSTAKKNFELGSRGLYKNDPYSIYQFEFTLGTAVRNLITDIMGLDEAIEFVQPVLNQNIAANSPKKKGQ